MSEWKDCKDQLPDNLDYVLCYCAHGGHFLDRYIICNLNEDGNWSDIDYYDVSNISHWMHLPDPPKE